MLKSPKIVDTSLEGLLSVFSNLDIDGVFEFQIKDDQLVLVSEKNESGPLEIVFPAAMYCRNTFFPKFVFCTAHLGMDNVQFMSHWDLMYILLEDRFKHLSRYETIYGGLIQQDVSNVLNYAGYMRGNAFNTKVKNQNVVVLLDPYVSGYNGISMKRAGKALGDWLFADRPGDLATRAQLSAMNIIPGSETMLSESYKAVVYQGASDFKAPGYETVYNENGSVYGIRSLFKPAQSLPARLKTHLHGEAYSYLNPDNAIYLQDAVFNEDGTYKAKDDTLRNMIVVFEEIDEDSYRFGAGEIEVSERFGTEVVHMKKHKEVQLDEVFIRAGNSYQSNKGKIKIGTIDGELRSIDLVDEIYVTSIQETGFSKGYQIEYIAYNKASNARITSQTGLKGVTKVMAGCGYIKYFGQMQYIDAVCSINSLKGKMNTIILAQAALAVYLGFYVPKQGKLLDSLDEEEINAAAKSLPDLEYVDRDGNIKIAKVGLIQASVTELGSMYTRIKPQTFSFNALKYIKQEEDSRLADYILEHHVSAESKAMVMELGKIIQDEHGYFSEDDSLPIYTLDEIRELFDESDLVLQKRSILPCSSKLLDEEYNTGFYIHCKPLQNKYIRIPPAKMLNDLCGELANGEYIYPDILINISKIISHCLPDAKGATLYHYVVHHPNERNKSRMTASMAYLRCCRRMLFLEEAYGNKMIQSLLAPVMPGIGLKQLTDKYVPEGKVVILDNTTYRRLREIALEENAGNFDYSIKAFAVRHPFLWKSMFNISEVWGTEQFAQHLKEAHGIELNDYIVPELNRYCVLIPKSIIKGMHSDCDGDLLSISIPKGLTGQILLEEFQLSALTEHEEEWDQKYLKKETSSNEDFDWDAEYKLYKIPNRKDGKSHDYYINFLCNAAQAKSAVGEQKFIGCNSYCYTE